MKACTLDLRERGVKFVQGGGTRAEAARRFSLGERTVYRYLAAAKTKTLAPKTTWGGWRKLDPARLAAHVRQHPDATLKELQIVFGVSHQAIWVRLGQLGLTLKKLIKYHERNEVQRWLFRPSCNCFKHFIRTMNSLHFLTSCPCSSNSRTLVAVSPNGIRQPVGKPNGVRVRQDPRIANPRYSRIPFCATTVAAQAALGSSVSIRG